MTDAYPFPNFFWRSKNRQVNASACLFPSAKKNREVRVGTSMGLLLEVILQHKQNLKRYLGVYELTIIDESKQPVPPVWLRGESINRLMTIWTINLSGTLR